MWSTNVNSGYVMNYVVYWYMLRLSFMLLHYRKLKLNQWRWRSPSSASRRKMEVPWCCWQRTTRTTVSLQHLAWSSVLMTCQLNFNCCTWIMWYRSSNSWRIFESEYFNLFNFCCFYSYIYLFVHVSFN